MRQLAVRLAKTLTILLPVLDSVLTQRKVHTGKSKTRGIAPGLMKVLSGLLVVSNVQVLAQHLVGCRCMEMWQTIMRHLMRLLFRISCICGNGIWMALDRKDCSRAT